MKFKKFLKFVFVFSLFGSMISDIKAQNIGIIEDFRISFWHPGYTTYVYKITTNRPHVLNLRNTGGARINVFYTLLNSNDEAKSTEAKMATRDIGYASNTGQAGYKYKLKIRREYFSTI